MTSPLVSVILPLFNGDNFIAQAMKGILSQTFDDFEVLVIDDGSTDGGPAIVSSIADPRVRLVRQENRGLAMALNVAIGLAHGRYLARQDHDDISVPTRLEKQVAFLEANPEIALLGTRAEIWVGDKPTGRYHDHPCDDPALQFELLFNNPFVHSSIMMRADAVRALGGYPVASIEDYDLWSKLARVHRIANLHERLVYYREVPQSISRTTNTTKWGERLTQISAQNLAFATGRQPDDVIVNAVAALHHGALHLCSRSVRLADMQAVVRAAAASVQVGTPASDVGDRCERILRIQRYKWMEWRHGWLKAIFRRTRHVVCGFY